MAYIPASTLDLGGPESVGEGGTAQTGSHMPVAAAFVIACCSETVDETEPILQERTGLGLHTYRQTIPQVTT